MADQEKEHNTEENVSQSVNDTVENFFKERESAAESSPEETQATETSENGSDPAKTQEPQESAEKYEGIPKGFENHPSWLKREAKYKEAQAKIQELERAQKLQSELLDDPVTYRRYLKLQGFNEAEIAQAMARAGYAEEKKEADPKQDEVDEICKSLGWDPARLDANQRAYIKDLVRLQDHVLEKRLEQKLRPIQERLQRDDANNQFRTQYDQKKETVKKLFPQVDWEKEVEPAMKLYLDELDEKDPRRTIQVDFLKLADEKVMEIVSAKLQAKTRQEDRNEVKKVLRPLTPGPSNAGTKPEKGRTARETADNFLKTIGVGD